MHLSNNDCPKWLRARLSAALSGAEAGRVNLTDADLLAVLTMSNLMIAEQLERIANSCEPLQKLLEETDNNAVGKISVEVHKYAK